MTGQEFLHFLKKPVLEDASNQELLQAWNTGNEAAARLLVQRYLTRLLALAKSRLSRTLGRRLDAEDIVFSVWRSFFVGVDQGRFEPTSEDDLWPLLVTLTVRKLAVNTRGIMHFCEMQTSISPGTPQPNGGKQSHRILLQIKRPYSLRKWMLYGIA